jgi:hypothetical protein
MLWFNTTSGGFKFYDGANTIVFDSALSDHLADTSEAHAASAISAVDEFFNSASTNVQDVLDDLDAAIGDFTTATYNNYVDPGSDNVVAHLNAIDTALSSAGGTDFSDATFRISDNTTSSKKIAFEASSISDSTVRTITMPDADVNLGDIAAKVAGAGAVTDNRLVRFDGTDGKTIQQSGITVDDSNNVTGVNDLTVTGDLTVNGTTTTINTDNLNVEDKNITVNKNGTDVSSEGAGLTVEREGTNGSIIYAAAAASKFKVGAAGAEVEIADISTSQTLTNKTIDADNNTVSNIANDEIKAAAGIVESKLSLDYSTSSLNTAIGGKLGTALAEAKVFIGSAGGEATAQSISGDITLAADGTVAIASGAIVNADVNASAAIVESKLSLDYSTSSLNSAISGKMSDLSDDLTPSLGGNLDAGSNVVFATNGLKLGNSASEFFELDYEEAALSDNTTAVISDLTYAAASYEGCIIEYKVKEATANKVRVGQLFVANNASSVSLIDQSTETADPGVSFSAALNSGNIEISYTTTSTGNARSLKSVVKRLKV